MKISTMAFKNYNTSKNTSTLKVILITLHSHDSMWCGEESNFTTPHTVLVVAAVVVAQLHIALIEHFDHFFLGLHTKSNHMQESFQLEKFRYYLVQLFGSVP